jgi:hypothetical protein
LKTKAGEKNISETSNFFSKSAIFYGSECGEAADLWGR